MKHYKVGYKDPFTGQTADVLLNEKEMEKFLVVYNSSEKSEAIAIPKTTTQAIRRTIFYKLASSKDFKRTEKVEPKKVLTKFDKTEWNDENKTEWKKILSGVILFYGKSIKCLPLQTINKIAKSAFNLPLDSKMRNKFLGLGDENFNYSEWMEYTN